ncbi:MAG: hypothetical protein PHF89_02990 [Eubacteriales bacterium]|nr:hypothetical protein [Eubacteriales bacterium]
MGKLINWIKGRYYRLKYRVKSKDDAAFGIVFCDKNNVFYDKLDEISKKIKPCYKTIAQLKEYIVEKYNAKEVQMSKPQLESFKINLNLSFYPKVLHTPQIQMGDKPPKRAEFLKWHKNNKERFEEARKYPIEKLGLVVSSYQFDYMFENGKKAVFQINTEEKTGQCTISTSTDDKLNEAEHKVIRSITCDIDLYKGVTGEDIDTRSPRFLGYASSLMEMDVGDK